MKELIINADYRHEKTQNLYHTLVVSSEKDGEEQQVVYIDNYNRVWSKGVERFLNGMTFLNKDQIVIHNQNNLKDYPNAGDFYYDSRSGDGKAHAACSVMYVTNIEANEKDYPITVFYLCDGLIEYMTLEEFNKHFKK